MKEAWKLFKTLIPHTNVRGNDDHDNDGLGSVKSNPCLEMLSGFYHIQKQVVIPYYSVNKYL